MALSSLGGILTQLILNWFDNLCKYYNLPSVDNVAGKEKERVPSEDKLKEAIKRVITSVHSKVGVRRDSARSYNAAPHSRQDLLRWVHLFLNLPHMELLSKRTQGWQEWGLYFSVHFLPLGSLFKNVNNPWRQLHNSCASICGQPKKKVKKCCRLFTWWYSSSFHLIVQSSGCLW